MIPGLEADVAFVNKVGGARQSIHPAGLAVRTAARRPARGRDRDLIFVAVVLNPRSPATSARPAADATTVLETQAVALSDLAAKTYFGIPGSVTSALRETANAVNLDLLQWNLRVSRQGINAQGALALGVLRESSLYLAQVGASAAAVVRPDGIERFPPEPRDSRPLGISQNVDAFYSHCMLSAGEYLVLGSENWPDAAFSGFNDLTLEIAADKLFQCAGADASILIARFVPAGEIRATPEAAPPTPVGRLRERLVNLRPRPAEPAAPTRPVAPAAKPPEPTRRRQTPTPPPESAQPAFTPSRPPVEEEPVPQRPVGAAPIPPAEEYAPTLQPFSRAPAPAAPAPSERRRPPRLSEDEEPSLPHTVSPVVGAPSRRDTAARRDTSRRDTPPPARPTRRPARGAFHDMAKPRSPLASIQRSLSESFGALGNSISRGLSSVLRRVLPEGAVGNRDLRLPTSIMAAVAIGLPLVVGLVVTAVWIQRGQTEQYNAFFEQAQLEVSLARTAPDALSARPHWEAALDWLDKAEAIRPGAPEVANLRREAQAFIDSIDLTTRLDFVPLIAGGFGRGVNLTDLIVNGPEVYALDRGLGQVFRALRNQQETYALDEGFKCAGGPVGDRVVGPIVDMAWVSGPSPAGSDALLAMDGAGTLMFCAPDGSPSLATQLTPPDTGWTSPRAIALFGEGLYVLDPAANEIWQFNRPGGQFTEGPSRYFTSQSYDLSQAVDFAIANGDVFILFADGRMMTCARSADGTQTDCVQDAVFTDGRQGHTSGDRLDDVQSPLAVVYDPPPEPSLYLADSASGSVYQLSLKLVLQRQFRPTLSFETPPAAIAIGSRKEIYVAAGEDVFVGARP